MINLFMKYAKLSENAHEPRRATPGSAGYDLISTEECALAPGCRKCIGTGLSFEIPEGYFGHILPRSGLALTFGLSVMGGVVDSDYREEVKVILHNTSTTDTITLPADSRIAQIVFMQCFNPTMELTKACDVVDSKHMGFGSTGLGNVTDGIDG